MAGFIYVGAGGALGAVLRYAISLLPYKGGFPLLTFLTNVIGAVVIGCIAGVMAHRGMNTQMALFLKTGVCGGFTTFSSFALETGDLLKQGNIVTAVVYAVLSMVIGVLAVFAGQEIIR